MHVNGSVNVQNIKVNNTNLEYMKNFKYLGSINLRTNRGENRIPLRFLWNCKKCLNNNSKSFKVI